MTAQFKVGSVYRDQSGRITRVVGPFSNGEWRHDGHAWVKALVNGHWSADGYRCPETGCDSSGFNPVVGGFRHLVPGELHEVNGQWVPVAEEAPKTVTRIYRSVEDRDEAIASAHYEIGNPVVAERVRPPLTWATPKPVDRWEGFTTNYNTEPQFEGDTHPLQRMTDPSDPLHGSAFLRG